MRPFSTGLFIVAGVVVGWIGGTQQSDKQRFTDFACGYRYGTRDAVVLASPIIGVRAEFQPKPWCKVVEELSYKQGMVRIAPRD